MATDTDSVDLGFVNDDCDSRLLESHYFPSKVGGKPAWLSLKPLPPTDSLSCPKCNNPMMFLMQVYSPCDRPEGDAFHRTLFLFACKNSSCNTQNDSGTFAVFRSQLPRVNGFFGADPPPDDPSENVGPNPSAQMYQSLCDVCGCIGMKQCGRCHSVKYCSKQHQTWHWKAGHKRSCMKASEQVEVSGLLFPECELEIEDEKYSPDTTVTDEEKQQEEYEQHVADMASRESAEGVQFSQFQEEDLEVMASQETEDDKQFERFRKRVAQNSDQVLRYNKGGEPLWVSCYHQIKQEDLPACSCGAPRQFEFQVMPQLLNYLNVDNATGNSLDWGTLCVYTCRDSCAIGNKYVTEFIWKQDFVKDS